MSLVRNTTARKIDSRDASDGTRVKDSNEGPEHPDPAVAKGVRSSGRAAAEGSRLVTVLPRLTFEAREALSVLERSVRKDFSTHSGDGPVKIGEGTMKALDGLRNHLDPESLLPGISEGDTAEEKALILARCVHGDAAHGYASAYLHTKGMLDSLDQFRAENPFSLPPAVCDRIEDLARTLRGCTSAKAEQAFESLLYYVAGQSVDVRERLIAALDSAKETPGTYLGYGGLLDARAMARKAHLADLRAAIESPEYSHCRTRCTGEIGHGKPFVAIYHWDRTSPTGVRCAMTAAYADAEPLIREIRNNSPLNPTERLREL